MISIKHISILLVLILQISFIRSDIVVKTKNGFVRGYERTNRHGDPFYAFRSIPYAKPPIGKLRFQPPVSASYWEGTLNATNDIPICFQGLTGQEDCLYLSVFTKNIQSNSLRPKPVMVFFHGGGFILSGAQEDTYNPEYLLTEDIVLVTAAYRLGFLGFLNLGMNTKLPLTANAGMKDQVMVLKWVNINIKYFGGDPRSVTIFGESAGACSVHLHMFSPLSRGLFHRVILESGSAMHTWSIGKVGSGEILAEALNISTTNLNHTLRNLQNADLKDVYQIQHEFGFFKDFLSQPLTSPIIEGKGHGAFLPEHPKNLLQTGRYSHVPMIIGYNTKEGIFFDIINKVNGAWLYLYETKHLVPSNLNIANQETLDIVIAEIEEFYFGGRKLIPETDALILVDILTDIIWVYGIRETVKSHYLQGDEIYFYEFGAHTKLNFFKRSHPVTALYEGACHMDELGYLFKNINATEIENGSIEDRMVDKMVGMWRNFTYYGNPTPSGSDIHWDPVEISNNNINYFRIRNDEFTNELNPLQERMLFWEHIYETYGIN